MQARALTRHRFGNIFPHAGSRLAVPGWILLGAVIGYIHFALENWLFRDDFKLSLHSALYFSYFILLGIWLWFCISYLDVWALRSRFAGLQWRIAFGLLLTPLASAGAFFLIYHLAFPLVIGRAYRGEIFFNIWTGPSLAATLVYAWLLFNRSAGEQAADTLQLQLETDQLATARDSAELAMVEAQIEPHFLFNTLAHVKRQYRLDAATADQTLTALIDYLDSAIPALQRADWRVGDELALIQVYLEILQRRFAGRLEFSIEASAADKLAPLPALTIATLVENAVRHGLAPKSADGQLRIAVEPDGDSVLISVCDNGVGLRKTSGSGLGLATVRARLRSQFGNRAVLLVEPQGGGGVRASIRIPCMVMTDTHAESA